MAKKEMSFAAWVRNLVMQKPDLTLEQLQEEFAKSGRPAKEKPNSLQPVYQAKNIIKKRWGVDLSELPRNKDGSLNISGMVRLYIDKFGDGATEKKAKSYFEVDGVELKAGSFANAKTTYLRKKGNIDPNVGSGPRARFEAKRGRKAGKGSRKPGLKPKAENDVVTFDLLVHTKEYIQQVGGVEKARALMNFIEEIKTLG